MNEKVWHEIFKKYIECYEAIKTLADNGIIDCEEEKAVHEHNLLWQIIETMRSEVEE